MGLPCFPKASRKLQRTLKNLRVSLLCFLLTFLVLRNTIGAGKFGTPAQDFEEIRLHLRNVRLHRRHLRVLAQAVEEEKSSLEDSESFGRGNAAAHAASEDEKARRATEPGINTQSGKEAVEETQASWANDKERNAGLSSRRGMRWNPASLTLDVRHRNGPLLRASNQLSVPSLTLAKKLEASRLSESSKLGQSRPNRASNVVVVAAGLQPTSCRMPTDGFPLPKPLQNILKYSSSNGFEVSVSHRKQIAQGGKPLSKISLLQSVMESYSHMEWIWWVPSGVLFITHPSFAFPLQTYSDYNIVLLGAIGASYILDNLTIDLNTDAFLIRNCQWSLEVMQRSAELSAAWGLGTGMLAINSEVRKESFATRNPSLSRTWRISREKIYVEDSVVLRAKVEDLMSKHEEIRSGLSVDVTEKRLPFITQLLDCKSCGEASKEEDEKCFKQLKTLAMFLGKEAQLQKEDQNSGILHANLVEAESHLQIS